tara:strand:+ start:362 stop:466 length:105 start_codon:yes stop_codon:yes gene_type:complete
MVEGTSKVYSRSPHKGTDEQDERKKAKAKIIVLI